MNFQSAKVQLLENESSTVYLYALFRMFIQGRFGGRFHRIRVSRFLNFSEKILRIVLFFPKFSLNLQK